MANNDDLMLRIKCMYEAIGDVEETDFGRFKPKISKEGWSGLYIPRLEW